MSTYILELKRLIPRITFKLTLANVGLEVGCAVVGLGVGEGVGGGCTK